MDETLGDEPGQHIAPGSMAAAVVLGVTLEELERRYEALTPGDRELFAAIDEAWAEHRGRGDRTVFWIPAD